MATQHAFDTNKHQLSRAVDWRVFEVQSSLVSHQARMNDMDGAKEWLLPQHYEDVVEERVAGGACGYPLCRKLLPDKKKPGSDASAASMPNPSDNPRYRISLKEKRVYEVGESQCFCSVPCQKLSRTYGAQLSTVNPFLRNVAKKLDVRAPRGNASVDSVLDALNIASARSRDGDVDERSLKNARDHKGEREDEDEDEGDGDDGDRDGGVDHGAGKISGREEKGEKEEDPETGPKPSPPKRIIRRPNKRFEGSPRTSSGEAADAVPDTARSAETDASANVDDRRPLGPPPPSAPLCVSFEQFQQRVQDTYQTDMRTVSQYSSVSTGSTGAAGTSTGGAIGTTRVSQMNYATGSSSTSSIVAAGADEILAETDVSRQASPNKGLVPTATSGAKGQSSSSASDRNLPPAKGIYFSPPAPASPPVLGGEKTKSVAKKTGQSVRFAASEAGAGAGVESGSAEEKLLAPHTSRRDKKATATATATATTATAATTVAVQSNSDGVEVKGQDSRSEGKSDGNVETARSSASDAKSSTRPPGAGRASAADQAKFADYIDPSPFDAAALLGGRQYKNAPKALMEEVYVPKGVVNVKNKGSSTSGSSSTTGGAVRDKDARPEPGVGAVGASSTTSTREWDDGAWDTHGPAVASAAAEQQQRAVSGDDVSAASAQRDVGGSSTGGSIKPGKAQFVAWGEKPTNVSPRPNYKGFSPIKKGMVGSPGKTQSQSPSKSPSPSKSKGKGKSPSAIMLESWSPAKDWSPSKDREAAKAEKMKMKAKEKVVVAVPASPLIADAGTDKAPAQPKAPALSPKPILTKMSSDTKVTEDKDYDNRPKRGEKEKTKQEAKQPIMQTDVYEKVSASLEGPAPMHASTNDPGAIEGFAPTTAVVAGALNQFGVPRGVAPFKEVSDDSDSDGDSDSHGKQSAKSKSSNRSVRRREKDQRDTSHDAEGLQSGSDSDSELAPGAARVAEADSDHDDEEGEIERPVTFLLLWAFLDDVWEKDIFEVGLSQSLKDRGEDEMDVLGGAGAGSGPGGGPIPDRPRSNTEKVHAQLLRDAWVLAERKCTGGGGEVMGMHIFLEHETDREAYAAHKEAVFALADFRYVSMMLNKNEWALIALLVMDTVLTRHDLIAEVKTKAAWNKKFASAMHTLSAKAASENALTARQQQLLRNYFD